MPDRGVTVGVIANPLAGTDVRRLSAPAGHTSNAAKVGIVERVVSAAIEAGAECVLVANDAGGLGAHAVGSVAVEGVELLDEPVTGTRTDTVAAARRLWKDGCSVVVVLGGDGTCRDAAMGWPSMPMIAVSTGTNNVFPDVVDAVAVGTAAGLIAAGRVPLEAASRAAKRLVVQVGDDEHTALVDVAVLRPGPVGARAVLDAGSVVAVIAAISTPVASGLSSIAGRLVPLDDDDPDGVVVHLGDGGPVSGTRRLRVPLVPGAFSTVDVTSVGRLCRGDVVRFDGPLLLAFDGERDVTVPAGATVTVTVDDGGPTRIDVGRTLQLGAQRRAFDCAARDLEEEPDGH